LDKNVKAILGTGSLKDQDGKVVSWTGTNSIEHAKAPISSTDPNVVVDANGRKFNWDEPLFDAKQIPIIGSGSLTDAKGNVIPWSNPLFTSNKKPFSRGKAITSSNGRLVPGFEAVFDPIGKAYKLEPGKVVDKRPQAQSGVLLDSKDAPLDNPDSFYEQNGKIEKWNEASVDQRMKPIAGTGTIQTLGEEPISWTGPLFDSFGVPIDSLELFLTKQEDPLNGKTFRQTEQEKLFLVQVLLPAVITKLFHGVEHQELTQAKEQFHGKIEKQFLN
jgi:hypothetical protein